MRAILALIGHTWVRKGTHFHNGREGGIHHYISLGTGTRDISWLSEGVNISREIAGKYRVSGEDLLVQVTRAVTAHYGTTISFPYEVKSDLLT